MPTLRAPRRPLAGLLLLSAPALAGAPAPGSLLLFPEYDNRPGQVTYLTITNVDAASAVRVHLNYVDAATCQVTNRSATLTPRDTLTFVTAAHVPTGSRGYMVAYAQSTSGAAIDFDRLVGAALRVDGLSGQDWSLPPFTFQGLTGAGQPTDVNANGRRDLDGVEYERAPNAILVPRFFGQSAEPLPRGTAASDLVLLQPLAAAGTTTHVGLLVWNDNEEVYSSDLTFSCWTRVPLLSISGVFARSFLVSTNHAPGEVEGVPAVEAGWFQARGVSATGPSGSSQQDPPLLGFLVERRPTSAADLPFADGQ